MNPELDSNKLVVPISAESTPILSHDYPIVEKPDGKKVEIHTLFAVEQVPVLVEHTIGK